MSSGLYHIRKKWYHTKVVGKCRNTRFSLWWHFPNVFLILRAHSWTWNPFKHVNRYQNYSPSGVKAKGNKTRNVYECISPKNKKKMEFFDRLLCDIHRQRQLWVPWAATDAEVSYTTWGTPITRWEIFSKAKKWFFLVNMQLLFW